MRDDKFEISTDYVLGQLGKPINPKFGTGLILTILWEHTENGNGITEERLLQEARNSITGKQLIAEGRCILDSDHPKNRVKCVLRYLRSRNDFPEKPAVISRGDKLFLNKM